MGMVKPGFGSKPPKGTELTGPFELGEIKRCDALRNGLGPYPGHCRWCDLSILAARKEREQTSNASM